MKQNLSKAIYTCIYVEPHKVLEVYKTLLSEGMDIPPLPHALEGVCCSHMTIKFRPTREDVCKLPMGGSADLAVTGIAHDERCIALRVKQVYGYPVPSDNKIPHITFWVAEGTAPYYSNELLARENTLQVKDPPIISGVVGYSTGKEFKFDYKNSEYVLPATGTSPQ